MLGQRRALTSQLGPPRLADQPRCLDLLEATVPDAWQPSASHALTHRGARDPSSPATCPGVLPVGSVVHAVMLMMWPLPALLMIGLPVFG